MFLRKKKDVSYILSCNLAHVLSSNMDIVGFKTMPQLVTRVQWRYFDFTPGTCSHCRFSCSSMFTNRVVYLSLKQQIQMYLPRYRCRYLIDTVN